eukprot:gene10156-11239_t
MTVTYSTPTEEDRQFYEEALREAQEGLATGGIPIGAVLVCDGKVIGRGHNRRVQQGSVIRHGETDCLENTGRLPASTYRRCTLYTTLSPCAMCSGTILLYKIPRVVIGENVNFQGEEGLLACRGVELCLLQEEATIEMMKSFTTSQPHLWNEDIGEPSTEA